MPRCSKCQKEITQVLRCEMANIVSAMYLDEAGEVRLKERSFEPEQVEFLCPECNQKVFDYSEDAENFLKGLPLEEEEGARSNCPLYEKSKEIRLTEDDWKEIYYALQTKILEIKSGVYDEKPGDNQELINQLKAIQGKIGPNGELAAQQGVAPAEAVKSESKGR